MPAHTNSQVKNADAKVISDFGSEWSRFDQSGVDEQETQRLFDEYFSIFPWESIPANAVGFDLGCGSGRWAKLVANRVGMLHCIDASQSALDVTRKNLADTKNVAFHHALVENIPLDDNSMDFGYSLGVLHHIPDTLSGIQSCVKKLKPSAPMLLYLYYAFDQRPFWFKALWKVSDVLRSVISKLPNRIKFIATDMIAIGIYWPLARIAWLFSRLGFHVDAFPLSYYKNCPLYIMRNDALDRFGTSLEQRFTRIQIEEMMRSAGLTNITFREAAPYWCAVGIKTG